MAHSIQVFEQRSKSFNDLDLLIIIAFVITVISKDPDQFGLSKVCDRWSAALKSYGPGILDMELDSLTCSPSERFAMVGVLDKIRAQLEVFGTKIPAAVLNELVQIPGVKFHDYPVESATKAIDDLKKLLVDYETDPKGSR
jgi:hypothetical protein